MRDKVIKLLLVEDDPDMLDLTAYVLRRERFVVAEASDGAQALRRWRADRPDLVILDLGLPTLDGFEVLRQIRGDGETPILVLTGRRDAQDILRAFHLRRKLEVGVGGDVPGTISSVPAVGYIFRRSGPKPTAAAPATAVPKAVSATPPAAASLSTAAAS